MSLKRRVLSSLMLFVFALPVSAEKVQRELTISVESEIFAERDGVMVTQADWDARLEPVPEEDRAGVIADPQRISELLQQLLLDRALAEEGVRSGMLEDETTQAILWHNASAIIARRYADSMVDQAELDDYTQQAREIWLAGRYRNDLPERFDFTHLLISKETRSEAQAARIALELHARIERGDSLAQLVEEYSEDPTVEQNQGHFTEVPIDQLAREFAKALSELEPGEIGEPVRTEFGWHVVRLDQRHEARERTYEEALPVLKQLARQRHRERVRDQLYARLSNEPRQIREGAVQKLLERYGVHQVLTGED